MGKHPTGMTLVEVLMILTLLTVVALGTVSVMDQLNRTSLRSNLITHAQMIRHNFTEMLNNTQAWSNTLADAENKTFECLQKLIDCSGAGSEGALRPFRIKDPANRIYYDGLDSKAGFTENGAACSSYPSAACPFTVQLSWRANCSETPPCLLPQMEVRGKVLYTAPSEQKRIAYNPENYGFQLVKSMPGTGAYDSPNAQTTEKSLQQLCGIIGSQAKNPQFMALLKTQLSAMGLGDMSESLESLQRTCAQPKPAVQQ